MDVYGYCLDDPVNMVDPLGLRGNGVDISPVIDNAKDFGRDFSKLTLDVWHLLGIIPDPRQKGVEALADIIKERQKEPANNTSSDSEK